MPSEVKNVIVIQVASTNNVRDDIFDIYLNRSFIGKADLGLDNLVGNVFIGSLDDVSFLNFDSGVFSGANISTGFFDKECLKYETNVIEGFNQHQNGFGNVFELNVWSYEKSGEYLINPYSILQTTKEPSDGEDFYEPFYIEPPPQYDIGVSLNEFDAFFEIDYEDLTQTGYGAGVHTKADVSLSFSFLDNNLNEISSDSSLKQNQFIRTVTYDILDESGTLIYPNFSSGLPSTQFYLSKADNQQIFGTYEPNFGVRISLENSVEGSDPFVSDFFVYGNLPKITGFYSKNLASNGFGLLTGKEFDVNLLYLNDFNFVSIDRLDVYASPNPSNIYIGESLEEAKQSAYYLFSKDIPNSDPYLASQISLKKDNLSGDVPYYFKVVPFSEIGRGKSLDFGPVIFKKDLAIPQSTTGSLLSGETLSIRNLNKSFSKTLIIGNITNNTESLIDSLPATGFNTIKYEFSAKDAIGNTSYVEFCISPPVLASINILFNGEPASFEGENLIFGSSILREHEFTLIRANQGSFLSLYSEATEDNIHIYASGSFTGSVVDPTIGQAGFSAIKTTL